ATSTAAFWTYTSRFALFATPSPYTSVNGVVRTYTVTDIRTIKPSVTPTATPTSTSIYARYTDLQLVYQYYPIGAVNAESDLVPEDDFYSATRTSTSVSSSIVFLMPVTLTAPASCPTQFTATTAATVTIPSQVWDQIRPTSTVNAGVSTLYGGYQYNIQTWYLSAGAAPFQTSSYMYYRLYVASCSTLPSYRTTTGTRTTTSSSNDDDVYCYRYSYYCGTPLRIWIIIIASVIPGLFLLGILESWFWFRRLMMGKSAMRFGTVCWILISLWVLCFTRMQDARSKEDQKTLQENWKNMGSGAAFKAWWKWGFRHAYPVEHLGQFSKTTVGVVPVGQPLNPALSQAPPMFAPGAPPPGQPGQVYYYGPPPPGWVQTPDGHGFMPPQGYMYPQPQQAGYYASDMSKDGTMASSSPVSTVGPQHATLAHNAQGYPVSPMAQTPPQPYAPQPYAPQPVHPAPGVAQLPTSSPPPQGPVPAVPPPQAAAPPAHVSEAPANPAPANPAPIAPNAPQLPPLKNDPNNRDLYD
ncbi:hypothetical protein CC86DRAFT_263052, partial [Ophiobolus disseminans]